MKYDFDDILIVPAKQSQIRSRYEDVNPYVDGFLPLFTAPMDTVVNNKNYKQFIDNRINVVHSRTEKSKFLDGFNSFGLEEFINFLSSAMFDGLVKYQTNYNVLIDIANGHIDSVIHYAKYAKKLCPNITIMAGNIANPETYNEYCKSNAIDYARIGIGNGNGCLTTQQTGIGFPMASLIIECNAIKATYNKLMNNQATKIVADGGMKKYSDIIKALALGADYVMVGSIFNKALESASPVYWKSIKLPQIVSKKFYNRGYDLYKEFRGMSTKKSQELLGNKIIRTSEGVVKKQYVEYTLSQWIENFEHYLRSAMSYTNSSNLQKFIGNVDYNIISQNAFNRYNK